MNDGTEQGEPRTVGHWRRYRVLYAVLALCAAPVLASYLAYYVFPPTGRVNYGTLIAPRPVSIPMSGPDGRRFDFESLSGKWVMLTAANGACDARCNDALLQMRQQRLMTGKDRERVERLWLITDDAPVPAAILREYDGTHFIRAPAAAVQEALAPEDGSIAGHVWLVDPMGNLMLRWPQDPEPQRVKKDLARLLTASSHWVRVERSD